MSDEFKVAVGALITHKGNILLGQKKDKDNHPLSGQWHLPGGHIEEGENPEEAIKREIEEETGLEGEVFQLVEVDYSGDIEPGVDDLIRIVFHMEVDSEDAEPKDDLQEVKWIQPGQFEEEVGEVERLYLENSERLLTFLEKLEKMPAF